MLVELKQQVSLVAGAQALWPQANLQEGTNDCPFCGRRRKMTVRHDRFRCHHPSCGARGDLFDLLVQSGRAANLKEAIRQVSRLTGTPFHPPPSLEGVWSLYQQATSEIASWLKQRHIPPDAVGYSPSPSYLREAGWPAARLRQMGLLGQEREYMAERVVFALGDSEGRIVHFQGRALNPDTEPRWLSTTRKDAPPVDRYLIHPQSIATARKLQVPLLLAEGATDTLSLVGLGLPTVGTPGVTAPLSYHSRAFSTVAGLVAVYDNDTYPWGSPLEGQYKSWSAILPELVEVAVSTGLPILCAPPPSNPGCKDYNDWIQSGATQAAVVAHIQASPSLEDWILELLPTHPSLLPAALSLVGRGDCHYEAALRRQLESQDLLSLLRELT